MSDAIINHTHTIFLITDNFYNVVLIENDKGVGDRPQSQSPSSEKKRETTMDFAANIEKVREVSHENLFV